MRALPLLLLALLGGQVAAAQVSLNQQPIDLVRSVVRNELGDHQRHGYWRYWVANGAKPSDRLDEQIETQGGPVRLALLRNGRALDPDARSAEEARLEHLMGSADEQDRARRAYAQDEARIGRIVALLPEAFLYDYAGAADGCYRLRFRPNPAYQADSIEARVFHAMTGELLIDASSHRLARLEGVLGDNVDFAYGLLGRLDKGGWFRLERVRVTDSDWKTARLEIHMNGRALLFKTLSLNTSETRGGFAPVPAAMTIDQGARLLLANPESDLTEARAALPLMH